MKNRFVKLLISYCVISSKTSMDEIIGYSLSTLLQLKNANNQFFIRNYNLIKRFILEKDIPTLGIFHAYKV